MLYVEALAAPFTVNTMPDKTLLAFADHGEVGEPLPADGGDAERGAGGVRRGRRSTSTRSPTRLQHEGAEAFVKSWRELLGSIGSEARAARRVG